VAQTKQRRLSNRLQTRRTFTASPRTVARVGRNEPCPCGSGKKFKDCHEREGDAYLRKLAQDEQRKQLQERLKAEGVPWYRRLFLGG
jgi:hypothetical protein